MVERTCASRAVAPRHLAPSPPCAAAATERLWLLPVMEDRMKKVERERCGADPALGGVVVVDLVGPVSLKTVRFQEALKEVN